MAILKNIGSAKSPVNLGQGLWAFKRDGHWLYRDSQTKRRFGRNKFIEATDAELMLALEKRGFSVLCPAHECVDRPHLPCPACERDSLRALGLLKICS
jgi:hypothetical protein